MTTASNTPNDDAGGPARGDKLIAEWSVNADDQVLLAGLAVIAAMLLAFGWSIWGSDDGDAGTVGSTIVEEVAPSDD